jgi:hypothetical protein
MDRALTRADDRALFGEATHSGGSVGLVVIGLGIPVVQYWQRVSLERLQECRREIPAAGPGYFESPCSSMRRSVPALSGISRNDLESMLGPADYCYEPYDLLGADARCLQPVWMFYHLQALGGGLELACWTGGTETFGCVPMRALAIVRFACYRRCCETVSRSWTNYGGRYHENAVCIFSYSDCFIGNDYRYMG